VKGEDENKGKDQEEKEDVEKKLGRVEKSR